MHRTIFNYFTRRAEAVGKHGGQVEESTAPTVWDALRLSLIYLMKPLFAQWELPECELLFPGVLIIVETS